MERQAKSKTDHYALSLMLAFNDSNERLVIWWLVLSAIGYELVYCRGLVHQILNTLRYLPQPSDKCVCKIIDDETLRLEQSLAGLEQRLMDKLVLDIFSKINSLKNVNVPAHLQDASHILDDNNL